MIVYPAIDIKNGKCVRLLQGRLQYETVYGDDPAQMAQSFAAQGAKRLHVVDLDGAFSGKGANLDAVARIVKSVNIPVQLGGGIRSMADIERRVSLGVKRLIIGTAAVTDPEFVALAVKRFPGLIIAGIDAKNGYVAVKGWVEESKLTAVELGKRLYDLGIAECVFTDISKDGMLQGPSIEATRHMIESSGLDVIASGGISSVDDLLKCKLIGCTGAIVGKAVYDGRIDIAEAVAACE